MNFLYLLARPIKYYPAGESDRGLATFSKNPWQEILGILKHRFIIYLIIATTRYIWPLLFIYHLTLVVTPGRSVGVQPQDALILGMLALAGAIGAIFAVRLDQSVSLALCNKYEALLARKTDYELARLERVSARDFSVVVDGIGEIANLAALPLFLLSSACFLLWEYGVNGLYCFLTTIIFLPLSFFLSNTATKNYDAIARLASKRIELASSWARDGAVLKQFDHTRRISDLADETKMELRKRNIDTVLRGADSYIVGFGRLVPFLILSILGGGAYKMEWDGSILWLSIPLLSGVLSLPRSFVNYINVKRSLCELADAYRESSLTEDEIDVIGSAPKGHFDFDPNWPIWHSQLAGLLPKLDPEKNKLVSELLTSLRLVPEFGLTSEAALKKVIAVDGNNISEGQKLRLQLLRGYFAAQNTGCKMLVDNDLSCLDTAVAKSTLRALVDSRGVEFTQEAHHAITVRRQLIAHREDTSVTAESSHKPITSGVSFFLEKPFLIGVCLLFIPAIMMGYSANVTLDNLTHYELLSYILAGVALGLLAGLYIESRTRAGFSALIFKGLKNIQEGDASNVMQVISRDTDVAFERLSWYMHDIAWITALFIFNIFALSSALGVKGFLLSVIFSASLYVLYRLSIRELYATRIAAAGGFHSLIKATQNTYIVSNAYSSIIREATNDLRGIHSKAAANGVSEFFQTRARAHVAKSMMSIICAAISDFSIVLVVVLCIAFEVSSADFLFVVTSLLLVRSDVANVFLAITGYTSQSISKQRILNFSNEHYAVPVVSDGNFVKIFPFMGLKTYDGLSLKVGSFNTLISPSGGGKTQYMKSVSGVARSASRANRSAVTGRHKKIRCYYLNRVVLDHLPGRGAQQRDSTSLAAAIRNLDLCEHGLIFFDEITAGLSVKEAYAFFEDLRQFAQLRKLTLVIVDHRLELGHPVFLDEITVKRKAQFELTQLVPTPAHV